MRTVPLGNTGVDVSIYCLGAMYFGTRNDAAGSYRLLDQYTDAGGFFVDTANIYAHWVEGFQGGESETLLGEWMRARGNRSRITINGIDQVAACGKKKRMTAATASHIQHRAGSTHQRSPASHPGRGFSRCGAGIFRCVR